MQSSAALALVLTFLGCQAPAGAPIQKDASAGCSKFGENCEFAPGKLGTCVEKSVCEPGQNCLVCQSQH